jgi:hypothetical protein
VRRPLPAVFFRTETGRKPVRDWLKDLPKDEGRIIGEDIMTVQFRWPLPDVSGLVDNLGSGIWEARIHQENTKNTKGGQGSSSATEECLHQKQQKLKTNIAAAASIGF